MRRDKHRRVRIESSNLETQPACEIAMGLAQVSQASIEQLGRHDRAIPNKGSETVQ